jgi:hypothetical protein
MVNNSLKKFSFILMENHKTSVLEKSRGSHKRNSGGPPILHHWHKVLQQYDTKLIHSLTVWCAHPYTFHTIRSAVSQIKRLWRGRPLHDASIWVAQSCDNNFDTMNQFSWSPLTLSHKLWHNSVTYIMFSKFHIPGTTDRAAKATIWQHWKQVTLCSW